MVAFDTQRYQLLFKQMGYTDDNGATLLLRARLLKSIQDEIERRNWTQKEAADHLGVKPPRISEIFALRIDKFTVELLVKYLFRLGKEVNFELHGTHE